MRLASYAIALLFITSLTGCKPENGKAFVGNWIEETNSKIPVKISIADMKSGQRHFYAVKITDLIWDKETGVHYNTKKINAMLDKENNGFVMNAIHSSDGCYTYVKEIVKGESYVVLGEEEKEALRQAVNSHNELER